MEPEDELLPVLKIVLVGDSGVGKTCLAKELANREFSTSTAPTIGMDLVLITTYVLLPNGHKRNIKLRVWDTAGQERYRSVSASYYRDADGFLLAYDAVAAAKCSDKTFANLHGWTEELARHACTPYAVQMLATKTDLLGPLLGTTTLRSDLRASQILAQSANGLRAHDPHAVGPCWNEATECFVGWPFTVDSSDKLDWDPLHAIRASLKKALPEVAVLAPNVFYTSAKDKYGTASALQALLQQIYAINPAAFEPRKQPTRHTGPLYDDDKPNERRLEHLATCTC